MSLNEPALYRLLHDPNGPIGRLQAAYAEALVAAARADVKNILAQNAVVADAAAAGIDFEREADGSVTFGIKGEQTTREGKETASWYLAKKPGKESGSWMRTSAEKVFPG